MVLEVLAKDTNTSQKHMQIQCYILNTPQVFYLNSKMSERLLTCCLVDMQTALSLSALRVPGETPDDVERAGVQARDGQIGVGGVVLHVGV